MAQDQPPREYSLGWITGNAVVRFGAPASRKKVSDDRILIDEWGYQSGSVVLQRKLDWRRGTGANPFILCPIEMEVIQQLYNPHGGYEVTEVTTYFGEQKAGTPLRIVRQNFTMRDGQPQKFKKVFNLSCNRDQMVVDATGRPIGDMVFWDNCVDMLTARNPVLDREKQIYKVENKITAP
jgi:hypothetical protein